MGKVYFTSFKTTENENLLQKLHRLMKTAGFENIDFNNQYTAIKIHFGELGNLAFLRSNYAKVVADYVKQLGGKPYLTDCNTLYVGSRKNALDHLDTAYLNGFSPFQTGCHVLIGDGLKGDDEVAVPINQEYIKEAYIGRAVMDSDIFISLTHFKGHEMAGFGGTIKNIGMGCGSCNGKKDMHSEGKPVVDAEKCVACGACQRICAHDAPQISNGRAYIDHSKCAGCGRCIAACKMGAISASADNAIKLLNCKMAEYTYAVVKDKPTFHISLICDVSPNCDCHSENDIPIIPNVGMLASFDPISLDQACCDLCNKMPIISGSILSDNHEKYKEEHNHEHIHMTHPDTEWESSLIHGEKIGLGTREYELIYLDKRDEKIFNYSCAQGTEKHEHCCGHDDTKEKCCQENKVKAEAEEGGLDADLEKFLDEKSYAKKIEMMYALKNKADDEMLSIIAASLDTELSKKTTEDKVAEIFDILRTKEKYEKNRR